MAYVVGANLFLHVPKTGGKAVLSALRKAGNRVRPVRSPGCHNGHARESELRDRRYRWSFRFGFVRHPVDWWLSLRNFAATPRHGNGLFDIDPAVRHPFNPIIADCLEMRHRPVDAFVREIAINRHPGFYTRMLKDYYGADFSRVDWVGRQESLFDDLRALCVSRGLRVPKEAKRVNVSAPLFWGSISPATRKDVESIEQGCLDQYYGHRGSTVSV